MTTFYCPCAKKYYLDFDFKHYVLYINPNLQNKIGWVYYHISNAMQHSNMALETTALVMYDTYTFFYVVLLFLTDQQIS